MHFLKNCLKKYLIKERFDNPVRLKENAHVLWLHGASMGECKVLLNVALRLRLDLKEVSLLLTTQKAEVVFALKNDDIVVTIAPAPVNFAVEKFLKKYKPRVLILCENEVWPAYLALCKKYGVHVALISGRFKRAFPFTCLTSIEFLTFQTQEDKLRFKASCASLEIFENAFAGDATLCNWKLLPLPFENETLNAKDIFYDIGLLSIHYLEWKSLRNFVLNYLNCGYRILLAPRRLEEVKDFKIAIEREIGKRFTERLTILDKFGVLHDAISHCKVTVIGGSFVKNPGVHDFLEPLRLKIPVYIGPYTKGNEALANRLIASKIITPLKSGTKILPGEAASAQEITKFLKSETAKVECAYKALLLKLKEWMHYEKTDSC